MTRVRRRRLSRAGHRARQPQKSQTARSGLDVQALEAVKRFVRVLARCGYAPEHISQETRKACQNVPKSWIQTTRAAVRDMDAAAHVVTLWFSEPAYLDSRGNPKPLPLYGSDRSIQALVLQADKSLEPRDVLRHLLRRQVLRRMGSRYVPRERLVSFRGSGAPYHFRSVRGLASMLRTLEHNSEPEGSTPGWFEVIALNRNFPVSARKGFDKRLRRDGMRWLARKDADMHRCERARKRGEPTVSLGVGIYRFEEAAPEVRKRKRPVRRPRK